MKKIYIIIIFIIVVISFTALYFFVKNSKGELNYFVITKVYNNFDYKKELSQEFENQRTINQNSLDSIKYLYEQQLIKLENKEKVNLSEISELKKNYQTLSGKFENDINYLSKDYESKIWNRLNNYIEDYGRKKQMKMLFGASGNGVIFYADSTIDVTEDLIIYVNKRFNDELE